MKTKWMWALGITLGIMALFVGPILFMALLTYHPYGMLGYGRHMPMMHGAGVIFLAGLILSGSLFLLILGSFWLVKALTVAPRAE